MPATYYGSSRTFREIDRLSYQPRCCRRPPVHGAADDLGEATGPVLGSAPSASTHRLDPTLRKGETDGPPGRTGRSSPGPFALERWVCGVDYIRKRSQKEALTHESATASSGRCLRPIFDVEQPGAGRAIATASRHGYTCHQRVMSDSKGTLRFIVYAWSRAKDSGLIVHRGRIYFDRSILTCRFDT